MKSTAALILSLALYSPATSEDALSVEKTQARIEKLGGKVSMHRSKDGIERYRVTFPCASSIDDRDFELVFGIPNLEILLVLNQEKLTDASLQHLKLLKDLRTVHIILCPKITDKGLEELHHLPWLKRLDIRGTSATNEGLQRLKAALPKTRVN